MREIMNYIEMVNMMHVMICVFRDIQSVRIDLTDFNPHLMFLHRFHQCSRLELTAKLPQFCFTQNSVTGNCGHVTSE